VFDGRIPQQKYKTARLARSRRGIMAYMGRPQLIPPPDSAPPSIAHLSPVDRVRLWASMVNEGDRLLHEGFLQRHGDPVAARRAMLEWLDRRSIDATAAKIRMLAGRSTSRQSDGE
jgi:hypothetical protein